jgi:BirA family biotin operon repressor/biotin-[acetyl-CoA-carboxylase] ligase
MSHFNIIKLDAISSTNEFLKKKCKSNECKDGEIIWAKDQSNGRGQSRNKWLSQKGKSLTFSVYKEFDQLRTSNSFVLNACIALSIVNVLKKIGLNEVSIKWPNDIMAENKKIGGILIENIIKSEYIKSSIIGIGLNINEDKFVNLPYATSLFLEINKKIKLEKILDILIEELFKSFNQLNNRENYIINLFSSFLWKLNKDVHFKNKDHYFTAKVKGVKLSGNLIIELSDGSISDFNSNEIKMNYID